jgi:hypothetical protein
MGNRNGAAIPLQDVVDDDFEWPAAGSPVAPKNERALSGLKNR